MGEVIFKGSYSNGTSDCKPPPALPITTTMVRSKAGRLDTEKRIISVQSKKVKSLLSPTLLNNMLSFRYFGSKHILPFSPSNRETFFNCFSCVGIRMFLDRYVRFVGLSEIAIALGEGYGHGSLSVALSG